LTFRVKQWDEYVGQNALKERLSLHIDSALDRMEPLDHILLVGPPGCGKTTLANIISSQAEREFVSFIMPIKPQMMRRVIQMHHGIALFDEIHRLPPRQQEELLPLIEDGYYQMENGVRIENDQLTIIGATTEPEKIITPLYDRFKIKPPFDEYSDEEMSQIVRGMALSIGIELDEKDSMIYGRACGGVPRNAGEIVSMMRDIIFARDTIPTVKEVLNRCRLSEDGLTEMHNRYLVVLMNSGGAAGLEILVAHLRLPKPIIVSLERLLVKRSLIEYTKQGRSLTGNGYKVVKTLTKKNMFNE
jgi:Holliday junction DNA helicase RuvB